MPDAGGVLEQLVQLLRGQASPAAAGPGPDGGNERPPSKPRPQDTSAPAAPGGPAGMSAPDLINLMAQLKQFLSVQQGLQSNDQRNAQLLSAIFARGAGGGAGPVPPGPAAFPGAGGVPAPPPSLQGLAHPTVPPSIQGLG